MSSTLAPGEWVVIESAPDWGMGQVQSVTGHRVTVNFEHAGKRLVRDDVAALTRVADPEDRP